MKPRVLFRKDGHALLADRLEQCHWGLCTGFFSTRVAARESPHDRCRPCSRAADGHGNSPDDGTPCGPRLSDVSSCPQSRVWSPLKASRLLLRLLVAVFIPRGVVICGLDDTIERRRGEQITAKGISRAPVRSSHTHVVKASGLRWLAWMVLTPLAWADRVWALPFLTALCPSERFYAQRGRRHQPLTARAWQLMRLVVRWLPGREVALVADSSFAALALLDKVKRLPRGRVITRLRLDAALYDPPP